MTQPNYALAAFEELRARLNNLSDADLAILTRQAADIRRDTGDILMGYFCAVIGNFALEIFVHRNLPKEELS